MIIIFPCTDMSRKNFSTNAFLIDLSVCSYGTYITSFLYMSPQLSISLFQNADNPSNVSSPHPR